MINTKFHVYALDVVYGQGKDGQIFEVDFKTPPEMYTDSSSKFVWPHWPHFQEIVLQKQYECRGFDVEEGDVVVDIGANIGTFSRTALYKGASEVYAFEPHPITFNCLMLNNGREIKFNGYNLAIGDSNGYVQLQVGRQDDQSFFPMGNTLNLYAPMYTQPVLINTMDMLFDSGLFEKIDFLKVDIEGAEYGMFKNLSDSNLRNINKIAIEYHPVLVTQGTDELKDRLNDQSFEMVSSKPMYRNEVVFYKNKEY